MPIRTLDTALLPQGLVLEALLAESTEAMAVLDPTGRSAWLNTGGRGILGDHAVGCPSPFPLSSLDGVRRRLDEPALEYSGRPVDGVGFAVTFREVPEVGRRERELAAFARAAALVACEPRIEVVLDRLAEEVRTASGMANCAIVLMNPATGLWRYAGTSGVAPDFVERMERCRHNGAAMLTVRAYDSRQVQIRYGCRAGIADDPAWAPMYDLVRGPEWDTYVAVPLVVQGEAIGALAGFHPVGSTPGPEDLRFLTAMADQAAVAVETSRRLDRLRIQAARDERRRLARDMHDSVTQALYSLNLHVQATELLLPADSPEPVRSGLAGLRGLAATALKEMRALILHRRPEALREAGLVAAVRGHAEAMSAPGGLSVTVDCPEEPLALGELVEEDLFLIVCEALHNVAKHAGAATATVGFHRLPGTRDVVVEVTDDGRGFRPGRDGGAHLGMTTMAERALAHGGELTVRPVRSGGTTVRVRIPDVLPDGGVAR
ncbi:MAG: Histidine kinase, gyrase and HSP90-like ATPase family protein [Pseudonocardia sp.]|uniref:GAF domain-containing sensor histidine kinase n=1 Tax=Pseudonocardia sp. TaxID=60912 RepID=UPI002607F448|nr:GAF domain-containing sensor histidine kinase [Pseudonocardia sp.]MCU1631309.1 Histidine kinase, gyrase and HSP90-like ATPase family protein [Pseudonocardia sp.]